MKHKTLSFLLAVLMSMVASVASAADFVVDGIYYGITSSTEPYTAFVTYRGDDFSSYSNEYTGSVTIPESVTYSGKTYSVTSIDGYAFWGCTGLTSVTIGNSVTEIGRSAFYGCTGLTSVTIPNSVTSIGDGAFSGTAWYSNQPDGIVYAGKVAYIYKGTMPEGTEIVLEEGTLGIAGYAFDGCSGLTSIEIPNSVTSIGSGAFYGCSGLTSVEIPNSVTTIGDYAFYGCSGLTSVEIPNSVTSINQSAFYGCTGLTSVTIGNSVTEIGFRAFRGCSGLTSIVVENGNAKYDSRNGCNAIIETASNTLIAGCKNTIIPNSVTSIGESAFMECTGLTSIEIPNSVTSIGNYAFSSCTGITELTIADGEGTLELGRNNYGYGYDVGRGLFYDCPLEKLYLGRNISYQNGKSYGYSPFYGISTLTSVTINSNAIASKAYSSSSRLSQIFGSQVMEYTFGGAVETIGTNACYGLTNLKSVSIGEGVTSISGSAFYGCSGLTSIEIPNSVTSIGDDAFKECTGLIRTDYASIESLLGIQFGNSYANPLYYTKALNVSGKIVTELEIPESVAAINSFAFYNCNSIKKVTGGKNVTSIGKSAFYNNVKLTSVQIGGKVEEIKDYAFNKCPLTQICNYAAMPQNCGKEVFSIKKEACNLYVLPESVEQYENHQDWYEFNIMGMDAETVGIKAIDNGQLTMNNVKGVYDLSGRRVNVNANGNVNNSKFEIQNSKLRKGIYVVNGKKLLKR